MIKISILNIDRCPVWSLPGTEISLSYETPEIWIDENLLKPTDKRILFLAVKANILLCSDLSKITVLQAKKEEPITKSHTDIIEEVRQKRVENIRQTLSMKLGELKKVLKTRSVAELRILLEEEKALKNRKTIVDAIEIAISKHQAQVFNTVSKEVGKVDMKGLNLETAKYLDNVSEVVESEVKEVKIKLGTDE